MFGLGRKTKAGIRRTRNVINDRFFTRRDSLSLFQSLERLYYEPDYFFDILPNRKIIYVQIPKSGTSTIKSILSRSIGRPELGDSDIHKRKKSGLFGPRMVGLDRFFELMHDPKTFLFTVTRHPLDRLQSCYRDKFLPYAISKPTPYNRDAITILKDFDLSALDPTKPLPFDLFVKMACRSCYSRINGHWSAMSDIVPVGHLTFSHIGRLETIEETIGILRGKGLPEYAFERQEVNRSAKPKEPLIVTKNLAELINTSFADDFRNFGYEPIEPSAL